MKKRITALLIVFLLAVLIMCAPISFWPLNKAVTALAENWLGVKISYSMLKVHILRSLRADGVKVLGKGNFAMSAESASVVYDPFSIFTGRLRVTCTFENVRFYKSGAVINSISDILRIEPLGNLTFKTVDADFFVGKYDTFVHNTSFVSEKIKIHADASVGKDNNIICLLRFFVKEETAAGVPQELRDSIFGTKQDEWLSVPVGIMGNYKKPILRIMTKRIRINLSS